MGRPWWSCEFVCRHSTTIFHYTVWEMIGEMISIQFVYYLFVTHLIKHIRIWQLEGKYFKSSRGVLGKKGILQERVKFNYSYYTIVVSFTKIN